MGSGAVEIPEPVRMLALHPAQMLPRLPDVRVFEGEGFRLDITRWPHAQIVHPVGDGPGDIAAAVDETRTIARAHGKETLAWWILPEHSSLVPALERLGLVNEDAGGYEAFENALALVKPPPAAPAVEVREVDTWEDYVAATEVALDAFGTDGLSDEELREQWADYARPDNVERGFLALLDGRPVGSAFAACADAGVNLFGG